MFQFLHSATLISKAFTIFMLAAASGWAQSPSAAPSPKPDEAPFATQIKKTVVFIQTDCKHIDTPEETRDGKRAKKLIDPKVGTGFLISVADKRLQPGASFVYLVTNRHVIQPGIEDGHPCEVVNYQIRLNLTKKAQPLSSTVVALGSTPGWEVPRNPSIDLAAVPVALDPRILDFKLISSDMILTDDVMRTRNVAEGDTVVFSGLFIQYMGEVRVEPIVRTGTLAMLPDEQMPTTLRKPGKVYLAETHVFGGNSGSPMFIDIGGLRRGVLGPDYRLLGVVAGEIFETEDFVLKVATSFTGNLMANSGISMVVPGDEVLALLNCDAFKAKREAYFASGK
jgi:hypothetical protein